MTNTTMTRFYLLLFGLSILFGCHERVCPDGKIEIGDSCVEVEPDASSDSGMDASADTASDSRIDSDVSDSRTSDSDLDTATCECVDGEVCVDGRCSVSRCGDGIVDPSADEQCDDSQNGDDMDGCTDACNFTCEDDAACSDGDVCNGGERCDADAHICVAGDPLDCDDGDNCTADGCDDRGCVNFLIDADGDGYAASSLGRCATLPTSGGDCDDDDASTYPGAPEQCDEVSHDCDPRTDEDVGDVFCFDDLDGDGFPRMMSATPQCACPVGQIPARSDGRFDCADGDEDANPDVTSFREGARVGGGFDWNCDGVDERLFTEPAADISCRFNSATFRCEVVGGEKGWVGPIPGCGGSGVLRECSISGCRVQELVRPQFCR